MTKRKEQNRKVKEGKATAETEENKEAAACLLVQRHIRGIIARKQAERLRDDEMTFLGMIREKRNKKDPEDSQRVQEMTQIDRAKERDQHAQAFDRDKEEIKNEIDENKGEDINYEMKEERRQWILEKKDHLDPKAFKKIKDLDEFYAEKAARENP